MRAFARRWFWALVLVPTLLVGVLVRKGSIDSGFFSDDYAQHAMLSHVYPVERAPWDLFCFGDGTQAGTQRFVDSGFLPWWTHPGLKLKMLRPLPSLLRAFDDHAFGTQARWHHVHSFVWWGLMVLSVAALLAAALPRAPAAIALVLFALDDSQTMPVFWIANRSALCAMTFACAALWAHLAWRRGRRAARLWSIVLFALALASGEYALAMFGYLLCFELLSSFDGPSRLRALWPAGALCALFATASIGLGYGSAHSGAYSDPLHEPLRYLQSTLTGLPVLMGDLTLGNPADLWIFDRTPAVRVPMLVIGSAGTLGAAALVYWLARRRDRSHWLAVRWLVAGAALALLPVLGSFISGRLLLPATRCSAWRWRSRRAPCAARRARSVRWRSR
jgi:hypothetical protein